MTHIKLHRLFGVALATLLSLVAASSLARAHAVLEQREAKIGGGYKAVVKIAHGCDGSPTTSVRIDIPEGVIGVKPMPKPGWTITMERGAYTRAYKHYHGDLSEGVRRVTWTGGPLPDDYYDEFVLSTFVAGELTPGTTLYFPVTQTCEKGELAWTEIPAAGQDAHDLKSPAAALKLVANVQAADAAKPAGPIQIEQPWTRATPGGTTVGGGYVKLTNTSKETDRLIGASFARAKTVEVHIMTSEMGIMKMRHMTEGLELPPGVSVELKPGGIHLMLIDLSEGLKAGETVKGTLTFEKAGTVDVTFTVAPLGATAPAASAEHQH